MRDELGSRRNHLAGNRIAWIELLQRSPLKNGSAKIDKITVDAVSDSSDSGHPRELKIVSGSSRGTIKVTLGTIPH